MVFFKFPSDDETDGTRQGTDFVGAAARRAMDERRLPDPFRSLQGETIETAAQWTTARRPEIVETFRELVFGRAPAGADRVRFRAGGDIPAPGGAAAALRRVEATYEGPGGEGRFTLDVYMPMAGAAPHPVFLFLDNRQSRRADAAASEFWPWPSIVSRGYAAAVIDIEEVDPDEHDGFRNGVHGVYEPDPRRRGPDAWGTIAAWAWSASRAMDYFEAAPELDASRVALVGHSRCGKTALWAGASDPRFAMVVSNNSGCTGAAVSRGKLGETIRDINERFPHWFADRYKTFNGREDDLPVDQHLLLAAVAPRHLYVTSATVDEWADPASEFLSLQAAEPVFRLLGKPGLGLADMPAPDAPAHSDGMAYHLRSGAHDLTRYDWERFLDYADRYVRGTDAVTE